MRIPVAVLALGALLISPAAFGQTFPTREVQIITSSSGSGIDLIARLVAQGLSSLWHQSVIVEDRPGADGMIAAEDVARAAPDGYTLLAYGNGFWLAPFVHKDAPFNPVTDYVPITLAAASPQILVVNPKVGVKSLADLIALAKAKPGFLRYSSGGLGGSSYLSAELFKSLAGVDITYVPYKSSGVGLIAVLNGETQMMFADATAAAPYVKSGALVALGSTGQQPSIALPNVPTIAASGLPGYESETLHGFFAPAKTPPALVGQLNKSFVQVLNTPEVKAKLVPFGANVVASSSQAFEAAVKADMKRFGPMLQGLGGDKKSDKKKGA